MEQEIGKKPYWKEFPESTRKILFNFIFWCCVSITAALIYLQAYNIEAAKDQNENHLYFIAEYLNSKLFIVLLTAAFIYYLFCSFVGWLIDQVKKTNNSSSYKKHAWEELFSQTISIGSIINVIFLLNLLSTWISSADKIEIDMYWWAGLVIWAVAVVMHRTANKKD